MAGDEDGNQDKAGARKGRCGKRWRSIAELTPRIGRAEGTDLPARLRIRLRTPSCERGAGGEFGT